MSAADTYRNALAATMENVVGETGDMNAMLGALVALQAELIAGLEPRQVRQMMVRKVRDALPELVSQYRRSGIGVRVAVFNMASKN